jgi:hypothetical protein
MCSHESSCLLRLRVVADTDPSAIGAVVQHFQNLNIVPRRICAEFGDDDRLHIEVDVCGVTTEQLSLIAGKISQSSSIHHAHWHRLSLGKVFTFGWKEPACSSQFSFVRLSGLYESCCGH